MKHYKQVTKTCISSHGRPQVQVLLLRNCNGCLDTDPDPTLVIAVTIQYRQRLNDHRNVVTSCAEHRSRKVVFHAISAMSCEGLQITLENPCFAGLGPLSTHRWTHSFVAHQMRPDLLLFKTICMRFTQKKTVIQNRQKLLT